MSPQKPDFCPACNAENPSQRVLRETTQVYKRKTLQVTSPASECKHCGFRILEAGDLDALAEATKKAFQ